LLTYQITALFGQRILLCDISSESKDSIANTSSDFLMFDNRVVLRHDYNKEDGSLKGALLINEPGIVKKYAEFIDSCRSSSVSLGSFERIHPELFK